MPSSVSAFAIYQRLTPQSMAEGTAKLAKSRVVQDEVAYFEARIARLQSTDEVFRDNRLMRFILKAYGMEDQLAFPARIQRIMREDPDAANALVRRMTNPGYREINAALDFFNSGLAKLKGERLRKDIIARYQSARNEEQVSELSPNLQEALYFERKIGKVRNGYEIIGDPVLFNVVKTALNLPVFAGGAKIERLKEAIEDKLDMTKLTDTAYIRQTVSRFLVLKDIETRSNGGGSLIDMFA